SCVPRSHLHSSLFPYTTLFRSVNTVWEALARAMSPVEQRPHLVANLESACYVTRAGAEYVVVYNAAARAYARLDPREFELLPTGDRKSTRLNSSHQIISYAVFC